MKIILVLLVLVSLTFCKLTCKDNLAEMGKKANLKTFKDKLVWYKGILSDVVKNCNDLKPCDDAMGKQLDALPKDIGLNLDDMDKELTNDPDILGIAFSFMEVLEGVDKCKRRLLGDFESYGANTPTWRGW